MTPRYAAFAGPRTHGPTAGFARIAATLLGITLCAPLALALPRGRAWAPVTEFPTDYGYASPTLWTDAAGMPQLDMITSATLGTPFFTPYAWTGSLWRPGQPAVSPPGAASTPTTWAQPLGSRGITRAMAGVSALRDRDGYCRFVVWPVSPGSVGIPETVAVATSQTTGIAAAQAGANRWVAHPEQYPQDDPPYFHVRTYYSGRPGDWHALPPDTNVAIMCVLAPLDDHRALSVTGSWTTEWWSILDGDRVVKSGVLVPNPNPFPRFTPLVASLSPRRSGGAWLLWSVEGVPLVSSFDDGAWSDPEELKIEHSPSDVIAYYMSWGRLTTDGGDRPVVAWVDNGIAPAGSFRQVGCVAFPNDHGWDAGDEIPGTGLPGDQEDATYLTVARDRFGESWFAWDTYHTFRVFWTHTTVRATASDLGVNGTPRGRVVRWTLSEPAPGSAWTVERARGEGAFAPLATLRADESVAMSWTDVDRGRMDEDGHGRGRGDGHGGDHGDGPERFRYRIRRESVDAACVWTSGEARWSPGHGRHPHPALAARQVEQALHVELTDMPEGACTLALFDVQGREVGRWSHVRAAGESAVFDVALEALGAVRSGVYYARLSAVTGGEPATARVVLLR